MRDRPLFRQQALDAQGAQWLGSIRLAQPLPHVVAALLAVVVIALIVAFAAFGTYTKRATVPGTLEPLGGTLRLAAPAAGTVTQVAVTEGAKVVAGDVLFVLSGDRVSASGPTQDRIATQLDARRDSLLRDRRLGVDRHEARIRAARERLDAIDLELQQVGHEAAIAAARDAIAERNVERFEELARTGFVATAQAQARLDDALVIRAQRENYQRIAINLRRERIGIAAQVDDSRMQVDGEALEITRGLASLEQERTENEARRTTVVTAPYAAVVTGIAAHAGQALGAGALLATLVPDGIPLQAALFVSTRQIGFIRAGQRVRLRYAAYPYQKFGLGEGVVDTIERSPYAPQELSAQALAVLSVPGQSGDPVYRVAVTLDAQTIDAYGVPQPLRPGLVFEADVLQDRRRLYEWLLEPVYGLAGR